MVDRIAASLPSVAALTDLSLKDLRVVWEARYGPPPRLRSPELLRRLLAWRIEAEAEAGAVEALRRRLAEGRRRINAPAGQPGAGAIVVRVWEGVEHRAEIVEGGLIVYDGQTFDSLSAVARSITGVRWNGPRFFGLRPSASAEADR